MIESADVLLADGSEARIAAPDLGLSYRESRFKGQPADGTGEIVLGARFRLDEAAPDVIKDRLDDIRRWRQAHQPLGIPSAGSTFRNPTEGPSAGALSSLIEPASSDSDLKSHSSDFCPVQTSQN